MKNTKATIKWLCFLAIAGVLTIYSCKKETPAPTPTPPVTTTTADDLNAAAEDNSTAENTSDEMTSMADEAVDGNLTSYKTLDHCVDIIRYDFNKTNEDTVILDFNVNSGCGDTSCRSHDGKYRYGKIMIRHTAKPFHWLPGARLTIEPIGYCVNGNEIQGKREVFRLDGKLDTVGTTSFVKDSISVRGKVILRNGGGTITWNSDRTRTWKLNVFSDKLDDQLEITGSASGTSAKGVTFDAIISQTLVRQFCNSIIQGFKHMQFVSGILQLKKDGTLKRTIDFGDVSCGGGGCDGQAGVYDENGTKIKCISTK